MQRDWSSTFLLMRKSGHHQGEHQNSWTFPLSKQFELVIDILMHISGESQYILLFCRQSKFKKRSSSPRKFWKQDARTVILATDKGKLIVNEEIYFR